MVRLFRHYIPGLMPILLAGDLAVIVGSILITSASGTWLGTGPTVPKLIFLASIEIFLLYLADLYNARLPLGRREAGGQVTDLPGRGDTTGRCRGLCLHEPSSRTAGVPRAWLAGNVRPAAVADCLARLVVTGSHDHPSAGGRIRPHRKNYRRSRAGERASLQHHRLSRR
jgi:hypothetical protein